MNGITTIAVSPTAAAAQARHRAFHQKIADAAAARMSAMQPAATSWPQRIIHLPAANDPAVITDPGAIPVFPIVPPTPEPAETIQSLLAARAELCAALDRIDGKIDATGEVPSQCPSIAHIQKMVAKYFRLTRTEFLSSRRTHDVVRPRQIAMYLAKELTMKSLPEIGRRFNGKDHTTVLAAVRRIKLLLLTDARIAFDVAMLFQEITGTQQ